MTARLEVTAAVAEPDGAERIIRPVGRVAWALLELAAAGQHGCTPIDNPGPRWSGYVHKLRHDHGLAIEGLAIETVHETHGGPFSGNHARYVLRSRVRVLAVAGEEGMAA